MAALSNPGHVDPTILLTYRKRDLNERLIKMFTSKKGMSQSVSQVQNMSKSMKNIKHTHKDPLLENKEKEKDRRTSSVKVGKFADLIKESVCDGVDPEKSVIDIN